MEKLQKFIARFKKRKKLFLILVILAVVVFGWQIFISGKTQQPQYQTARAEKGTIVSSVSASGQVLTANVINITSSATGVVKQVFTVDEDRIAKGDKIAEIELDNAGQQRNASAWSGYLSAKNTLESAKATSYFLQSDMFSKWKTFRELAESSSYDTPEERALPQFHIAEKDWLAAENKYKNQQAVIAQTQAALNNNWLSYQQSSPVITAPISGKIENITIVPGLAIGGQNATSANGENSSNQTIAVIRNEGSPLFSFNFSEIDVVKIKIGQKATVTLDAVDGKTFTGKVVAIDKIGQVTSNVVNYPAIVQLDTISEDLLPNMSASANVIIEIKDNVLFVPSAALQKVNNQTTVRVMKRGQVQQIPVEAGISGDQVIEITSGISEGDEVIIGVLTGSQQGGASPFGGFGGGGFSGGALRPGGFGGGGRR